MEPTSTPSTHGGGPPSELDQLLDLDELAHALRADRSFAELLVARGELPHVRLGRRYIRVRRSDFESYVLSRLSRSEGARDESK